MAHIPGWHILDASFPDADDGISEPARKAAVNRADVEIAKLEITNLDRNDPPGYRAGGVPRGDAFNRNVFQLACEPCMPAIPVQCAISGFDPAASAIQWRLVCRHVLCRYRNVGSYRYQSASETFEREWRGQSRSAEFTIFDLGADPSPNIYSDRSRVQGGHAVLEVAARVKGTLLKDYVHLRITGANPTSDDVRNYLKTQLSGCDGNILYMLQAVFRQESGLTQFKAGTQGSARMTFTPAYHNKDASQPDCQVQFTWPPDPALFPLASYDFGVGISQFTEVGTRRVTADIAWDWRENVRQAANVFISKLQREFTPGMTWSEWAFKTWAAYNGVGPRAREYALEVARTPDGARISTATIAALPAIVLIQPVPPLPPPGEWVVA